MAKDRARNPKRVPSLGISEPISHVKTHEYAKQFMGMKFDSNKQTDEARQANAARRDAKVQMFNDTARQLGKTPVVKINSGAKINGEDY